MADTRIKAVTGQPGRFAGYLVVWGGPGQRDLQGEYFTPETQFGLEWYNKRPALFHHGLDKAVKGSIIGEIDTLTPDEVGLWAEGILDMRKQYNQIVLKLIERGALSWSSGSLPHLVEVAPDGMIKSWPIVEGSLTPTPAEPRKTEISAIKSAYQELGLDLTPLKLENLSADETPAHDPAKEQPAKEPVIEAAKDAGIVDPIKLDAPGDPAAIPMENEMNIREIIMQVLQAAIQAGVAISPEQQTAIAAQIEAAYKPADEAMAAAPALNQEQATQVAQAVAPMVLKAIQDLKAAEEATRSVVSGVVTEAMKGFTINTQPVSRVGAMTSGSNALDLATQQRQQPANVITMRTKYADLSAEDMSFHRLIINSKRRAAGLPPVNDSHFMRELADKAGKAYDAGQLRFGDEKETAAAIKGINFMKANELDHSTQASYGDEWVPDLWSSQLWESARMDNVIMPLFQTVEMPSNPFELPIESTDPTVYYVPETTQESELLLSGSGNPIPDSKMGTGKVQLSAKKLALRTGFSTELDEDSIIPWVSQHRTQSLRAISDAMDNVILNGDTDLTASTNINLIDGTPAATAKYTALNGLRKLWIITTTANAVTAAGIAVTLAKIRAARFTLARAYSADPSKLALITHSEMYATLLGLSEFITMDKAGPKATAMTGQIGFIDGMPVLVSNEYALTDTAGKIPAAGGTLGSLTIAYKPGWVVGFRRRVNANVEFISWADSYQITATVRLALVNRDADVSSGVYNALV